MLGAATAAQRRLIDCQVTFVNAPAAASTSSSLLRYAREISGVVKMNSVYDRRRVEILATQKLRRRTLFIIFPKAHNLSSSFVREPHLLSLFLQDNERNPKIFSPPQWPTEREREKTAI